MAEVTHVLQTEQVWVKMSWHGAVVKMFSFYVRWLLLFPLWSGSHDILPAGSGYPHPSILRTSGGSSPCSRYHHLPLGGGTWQHISAGSKLPRKMRKARKRCPWGGYIAPWKRGKRFSAFIRGHQGETGSWPKWYFHLCSVHKVLQPSGELLWSKVHHLFTRRYQEDSQLAQQNLENNAAVAGFQC